MTDALVERIARLLHAEARAFTKDNPPYLHIKPWEELTSLNHKRYRHVARAVIKELTRETHDKPT